MPGDDLDWEEWDPSQSSFKTHVIAGSLAGLAEHVSIFPLDTLKTQLQCEKCGSVSPMQTWNCATRIVGREGIFRLWRGVSAMFVGCIPAHAAYFSIFESMKKATGADGDGHRPLAAAVCGAAAAVSHDLCMTPFDTVKQRMQLGYYNSVTHCFRSVAKREGIKAFYVSLPTTLAMNLPFGMIMVAVNESSRKWLSGENKRVSVIDSMLAGALAGGIAAATTTPLDIIKTRLQTQNLEPCPSPVTNIVTKVIQNSSVGSSGSAISGTPGLAGAAGSARGIVSSASPYSCEPPKSSLRVRSAIQVAKQIWREEGLKGFSRGIIPRVLQQAPAVAVSWTAYETAKTVLTRSGV
jgi:solute carrier family 25 (mitochondrial iron transporter), member 28/37